MIQLDEVLKFEGDEAIIADLNMLGNMLNAKGNYGTAAIVKRACNYIETLLKEGNKHQAEHDTCHALDYSGND